MLTKAYFLTAIPAVAAVYLAGSRRWRRFADPALALLTAITISGWWYWRNRVLTGSWSGLQEVAGKGDPPPARLFAEAFRIDWLHFLDVTWFSHVWSGNWSFLQVRSWMYRILACLALAALAGLAARLLRKEARPSLIAPGCLYAMFWLGLCYHETTFSLLGHPSGAGWYLSAVVSAEALLLVLGLTTLVPDRGWPWVLAGSAGLFTLLDLYATHFLLFPYYTGLISHRVGGALEAFHPQTLAQGALQSAVGRLMVPAAPAIALWICFLCASLTLPLLALRADADRE